jgi:tyrosine-specific transport protein
MVKNIFKDYIYPIAVFSGGMLGVGFLGLPYIAMKTGIWLMLLYFLVLTALVVVINLIFCEISLKTPDYKRFPGFVGYYLGKKAKVFQTLSTVLGTFGILLAYLLIGSQFLKLIFYPILPCNDLYFLLAYFFIVSAIVYFDIKVIAKVEFSIIILLFLSLFLVFLCRIR